MHIYSHSVILGAHDRKNSQPMTQLSSRQQRDRKWLIPILDLLVVFTGVLSLLLLDKGGSGGGVSGGGGALLEFTSPLNGDKLRSLGASPFFLNQRILPMFLLQFNVIWKQDNQSVNLLGSHKDVIKMAWRFWDFCAGRPCRILGTNTCGIGVDCYYVRVA